MKKIVARVLLWCALLVPAVAQVPPAPPVTPLPAGDQPDAENTRQQIGELLQRYPPELRRVLQIDPSLLSNDSYLAPYPALDNYIKAHPQIARNPEFYLGRPSPNRYVRSAGEDWRDVLQGFEVLLGLAAFMGLIAWCVRTIVDQKRWNRQNKVMTDVHARLLERLNGNEELLAYIQSPAGAKFLEAAPLRIDFPAQNGAPLGRIMWTVQAGIVITAAGIGLCAVAAQVSPDNAAPVRGLGLLGIAIGIGFVVSALVSFLISRRMGVIETPARAEN